MKIYKKTNVYEETKKRIEYIYDEFPNVIVSISGGKDSTVILNICLEVAKEKKRLPLNVMWIDQEAEWQATVDLCTEIFYKKEIKPYWFQMPIYITNNASSFIRFNNCWDEKEKDKWIHEKNNISIKNNMYGTKRFHELFKAIIEKEFGENSCYIAGVRTEESPSRFMGLTSWSTYKWITWGAVLNKKKKLFTFYPIYDWTFNDIWKYIFDNKIKYNSIYDKFYQYGQPIRNMRVSCLHHETSIRHLMEIQEIEPETWEKLINRIGGANTINQLKNESFRCPKELPYIFNTWKEYCIYLAEKMIVTEENKEKIIFMAENERGIKGSYGDGSNDLKNDFYKTLISVILCSDWDYTKLTNWEDSQAVSNWRKYNKTKQLTRLDKKNKYVIEQL